VVRCWSARSGLNLTLRSADGILNHTGCASRDGWRGESAASSTGSLHSTTNRRRAARRILHIEDLPAAEIELLGPTGSIRIDTLVSPTSSSIRGFDDIRQSRRVGRAMLAAAQVLF